MNDNSGQGLIEYSLILLLIALVIIVIISVYGQELAVVYSNIVDVIPSP